MFGSITQACSTQNVTFESECELYRQKCLCHVNRPGCKDPSYRDANLDYYGECQGKASLFSGPSINTLLLCVCVHVHACIHMYIICNVHIYS